MGTTTSKNDEEEDLVAQPQNYSTVRVFQQFEGVRMKDVQIHFWKMNLLAIHSTKEKEILFVAEGSEVLVYPLSIVDYKKNPLLKEPSRRLSLNNGQMEINQIRIDYLDSKIPVLLTVDDGGEVRIFFVDDLDRKCLCLSNDGVSTWGCSISKRGNLIAVSANSHNITVWNLETAEVGNEKLILSGHTHNIPCIDFSSCGRFIASTSIDTNARIWDTRSGKTLHKMEIDDEWGWSIKFIPRSSVKVVHVVPQTWESLGTRLLQVFPKPLDLKIFKSTFKYKKKEEKGEEEGEEEEEEEGEEEMEEGGENDDGSKKEESLECTDLLLLGTFSHLFLCTSSFVILASLYDAIRRPHLNLPIYMRNMERLSLMEYIPELSLAIVGSQGCASVLLVRIVHNTWNGKYALLPDRILPHNPLPCALTGLTVTRHTYGSPGLEFFRVYILYQDTRMFCYEIRSGASDILDISSKML